jgi:phosphate transport system substrate-binding protein
MKRRKTIGLLVSISVLSIAAAGCSKGQSMEEFNFEKEITVVARDAASGTRGAFHEIMKIKVKAEGTETDNLAVGALEFDGTDKVVTAVEGDKHAIGYISVGSLSDRIKSAKINGVDATEENIKNGSYVISRPFLLVTKEDKNELVDDFLKFVSSSRGQSITKEMKYIPGAEEEAEYTASGLKGTIKVAGSTSVSPLMEKLQEEYKSLNPDVTFEMQSNGSSQGIKAAIDGSYDIGMSSRELKEDEAASLNRHVMAIDGIAVILNKNNTVTDLSAEEITEIYTGRITSWGQVK